MSKAFNNKLAIILIVVLSFAFFGKTVNYQFVWDDERSHLTKHEALMKGDLKAIWSKPYDGMYIPVSYTIWMGIKKMSYDGFKKLLNPKLFHLSNILLHTGNALLVFLILLLLFKNNVASFLATLLFLFHPMQVESVAWVSEFRGLLAAFFSLCAIYVFLKELERNQKTIKWSSYIISSLLFLLALLSKPSVVIIPFILLVLIFVFYKPHFKKSLLLLSIWIFMFIPIVYLTASSQGNELLSFVTPLWQRPFLVSYSMSFYLYKFLLPFNLSACYGITPEKIVAGELMYVSAVALLGLLIFLFVKRNQSVVYTASLLIVLLSLLPVTGLIAFHYQRFSNVADRYMYIGMFGFALLLAYSWIQFNGKKMFSYGIIAFLILCSVLTAMQSKTWQNEFTMWDNAANNYPEQWTALYNRGVQYGKQGQLDAAISDYTAALEFKPNDKNTLVNRANAFGMKNKFEQAIADYSSALKLDENDASIYYNRALTYYYMKNIKACSYDLQMSIMKGFKADPRFVQEVKAELKRQFGR
ncbi:MAG: tetratricopeptide repeat protein [Bacteroidetes bacterium]|nr:tetratricopeptide repeat protein [Bacteroidota bacterium]